MIEVRQLKHILALTRHKNFKRAAESVFLSQPALSLSIKAAETWFGQKLFERSSRKVVPTPFGEVVIKMAERVITDIELTQRQVTQISGFESSLLRIGLSPIFKSLLGKQLVSELVTRYPKNMYHFISDTWEVQVSSIKDGTLDLALEVFAVDSKNLFYKDSSLKFIELDVPGVVYYCRAGHPVTRLKKINGSDIMNYPWAIQPLPPWYLNWIIRATGIKDVTALNMQAIVISNDLELLKRAVLNSDCISGSPYSFIEQESNEGKLQILNINWNVPHPVNIGSVIYSSEKPLSPLALKAVEIIREILKELMI
jgi:DNA-binding transcriptional LysR family regulator